MVAGAALLAALACGGASVPQAPSPSTPVPVPAQGAYLGAWVNPAGDPAQEESQTQTFESQIGRKLALHMHYYGWKAAFPDAAMQEDAAAGRIPVVTWACGDDNASVASGADDALLQAAARGIKDFAKPVFIRWYWEMNLAAGANGQDCMGTGGAAGYVAAWQHMHAVFAASGVTNVSWLWNPAAGGSDPAPDYPGAAAVDWIGFDGYDKSASYDFGVIFHGFYDTFSSSGKPMLVAETGECQTKVNGADAQATYLQSARLELEGQSNPGKYSFPAVKGFMIFDAQGPYQGCPGAVNWPLSAGGISGFSALGADPFFNPH